MKLTDNFGRVHDYLRVSLTDRCNLNCLYCNPLTAKNKYFDRSEILSFKEIHRLINIFAEYFDVKKVRFTGGEPLVRKDLVRFTSNLKPLKEKYDFKSAITTNGVLLLDKITELYENGLDFVNISLDSLRPEVYKLITGKDELNAVLDAIFSAKKLFADKMKINCVIIKGVNDSEIISFADFAAQNELNVRFIEYMPFANNGWNNNSFFSAAEMMSVINSKYYLEDISVSGSVSKDYRITGRSGKISFISSISDHFCGSCSRLRLTAKGNLRLCLFSDSDHELNIKNFLRNGEFSDFEIAEEIMSFVKTKSQKHPSVNELVKLDYNYMLKNGG